MGVDRIRWRAPLFVGTVALLMSACVPAAPSAPAPAPAAKQAAPASGVQPAAGAATKAGCGGTVTEGTNGDGSVINPILLVDSDGYWRTDLMFDALVELDAETLKPKGRLAKSWEVSPDGLTYTFTLQQGVKWHDGKPFSADDVKFTVMSMLAADYTGPFQKRWHALVGAADVSAGKATDLEGLKVLNPTTVQFKLTAPDATFVGLIIRDLKPIPKHILDGQKITREHPYSLAPVGTGPYKFSEWVKGDRFVMEANPDYWGSAPCMKRIVQRVVPDMNALVLGVEAGDYDFTIVPPPSELGRLGKNPRLSVLSAPPFAMEAIQFNLKHPQLSDLRVRQAIAHAFDAAKFQKENMADAVKISTSPVVWGSWASDPGIKGPAYDMAKAKQLLTEAGHPNGGFSVTISANAGNTYREEGSTILQAKLKELGIDAKVAFNEWGTFFGSVNDKKFDIAFFSFNGGFPDPDRLSLHFQTGGPNNYYSYSNPKVDDLLAQARKINDFDQRKALYSQVQQIVMQDLPIQPVVDYPNVMVINKKFKGQVPSSLGHRWNIKDWSIE